MAKEKVFAAEYAGHVVRYSFRNPGTEALFRGFVSEAEGEGYDIRESEEFFLKAKRLMPYESDEGAEFRSLICLTSQWLLPKGCCLFHSVSFVMDGLAWVLTAPSGTGKTTQYLNWQRAFPCEISMISGDMPVLEAREDGGLYVHPSPWNGKERFGSRELSAPLGGVVILEQGQEDTIRREAPMECLYQLMRQAIVYLETEEQAAALAGLFDRVLRRVPVLRLVNQGGEASTALLRAELKHIASERRPE